MNSIQNLIYVAMDVLSALRNLSASEILAISMRILAVSLVVITVKRRYFSPLSKYPGPFLGSISSLWQMRHAYGGRFSKDVFALHMKHGKILYALSCLVFFLGIMANSC
jgi:hypothetical protein